MSRIEEAIRRVKGGVRETAADGEQLFMPAWPVADEESSTPDPGPGSRLSVSSAWRDRLATGTGGDPVLVEQFRRLAATLHHAHISRELRSIMVTSATPGDGKTLTALNLAFVLAESYGYRVLLVDADLRRPSISSIVDLADGAGLSEALRAPAAQKLALARLTPRLTLLPAGQPTVNSIEVLVSQRMRMILDEATAKFDWVILDAPPVGLTADARLLSHMVEGTLFVIRAAKTQHADVLRGIEAVGREQILGVVLNDVEPRSTDAYYYAGTESGKKR